MGRGEERDPRNDSRGRKQVRSFLKIVTFLGFEGFRTNQP